MSDLAFARKKPVEWIAFSRSRGFAFASACAVGYFLNSAGVTMFTPASVDCAERIVATSSSKAFE